MLSIITNQTNRNLSLHSVNWRLFYFNWLSSRILRNFVKIKFWYFIELKLRYVFFAFRVAFRFVFVVGFRCCFRCGFGKNFLLLVFHKHVAPILIIVSLLWFFIIIFLLLFLVNWFFLLLFLR